MAVVRVSLCNGGFGVRFGVRLVFLVIVAAVAAFAFASSPSVARAQAFLSDDGYSLDVRVAVSQFGLARRFTDGNQKINTLHYSYGSVDTQIRMTYRFLPYLGGEALLSFPTSPAPTFLGGNAAVNTDSITRDPSLVTHKNPRPDMVASLMAVAFYPVFDTVPKFGVGIGWSMSVYGKAGVSYLAIDRTQRINFIDKTGISQSLTLGDVVSSGVGLSYAVGVEAGVTSKAWLARARIKAFLEYRIDQQFAGQSSGTFGGVSLQLPF